MYIYYEKKQKTKRNYMQKNETENETENKKKNKTILSKKKCIPNLNMVQERKY